MPKGDTEDTVQQEAPKATKQRDVEAKPAPEVVEVPAKVEAPSTEGLVAMTNGTRTIYVNPSLVKAHMAAGWKV